MPPQNKKSNNNSSLKNINSVLATALSSIKPSPAENKEMKKKSNGFLKQLNPRLKKAQALLAGSGAKNTWLADDFDIDIFVAFDYKKYAPETDKLSEHLEKALKAAFPKKNVFRMHGSRDYFQVQQENISFEVVPILKINDSKKALNITDVSPLHAKWVNKQPKKIKDQIRLAKKFCKAQNVYGAESHLQGFSGYALEIITAHYRSFFGLLKASQKWKEKEVIDVEKHYPHKDALFQLNKSKLQSPLIIIDPVDKNRNATAALSIEKLELFKKSAEEFLRKPALDSFQKKEISFESLLAQKKAEEKKNKKTSFLLYLTFESPLTRKDIAGVGFLKTHDFLRNKLTHFVVQNSGWDIIKEEKEGDKISGKNKYKTSIYFFLEKNELPAFEIRKGPPLRLQEHVEQFKKLHAETYIENEQIMAKIKIESRNLKEYLDLLLKDKYLKEKIAEVIEVKIA